MSAIQTLPLCLERNRRTDLHLFQEGRKFDRIGFFKLFVLILQSRSQPQPRLLLAITIRIHTKELQRIIRVLTEATFYFFF